MAPHRGGLVLGLGIGSIFLQLICGLFCGFFSMLFAPPMAVATIVLAFIDLNRMKAGQMDPSGKGITQAGLICAIVSLCIFGLGTLAFIAIFAIGPNGLQF